MTPDKSGECLAGAQIANRAVRSFIFKLQGILADQFAALVIAAACQWLEVEASPG